MMCSRCSRETSSKVLETRNYDGRVWRRRMCAGCLKVFVTVEYADKDLRMPPETQSKARSKLTDKKQKPPGFQLTWRTRK